MTTYEGQLLREVFEMMKSMKLSLGLFVALGAMVLYLLFLCVLSVEIAKIYVLVKYLKHSSAIWIAANFSFSVITLTLAYLFPIVLKLGLCYKSKFRKFIPMLRIVDFFSVYLSIAVLTLLFLGPPRILGAPKVDDIFIIKHRKLFIQLGLEHMGPMAKLVAIVNCFKDGFVELTKYPFSVKYVILAIVLFFYVAY